MNKKLSYFITKASMFEIGFFLLFKDNGKNAYISIILGSLIGLFILYIYSIIKNIINNKLLIKIFLIIFYSLLIIMNILVVTIFVDSFYLNNTPKIVIIIPFILIAYYLGVKDKSILNNISNLLFYGSILIVLIFSLLLIPYLRFNELLPLFNYNSINIIKSSLIYASISSIPQILIISYYDNFKDVYKEYIIASFINLIIILGTTLGLGNNLIKVYKFPEYDVLKQIKALNFIENIDSISAIGWYSELFIVLSLSIQNLNNIINKKNNIITIILLIVCTIISIYYLTDIYIHTIFIVHYYPFILLLLFITIIILTIIFHKKNNT